MIFPKGNSSHHLESMGEFLQSVVKRLLFTSDEFIITP